MRRIGMLAALAAGMLALGALSGCATGGDADGSRDVELVSAEGMRFLRWADTTGADAPQQAEFSGVITRRGDGCLVAKPDEGEDEWIVVLPNGSELDAAGVHMPDLDVVLGEPVALSGGWVSASPDGAAPCLAEEYFAPNATQS